MQMQPRLKLASTHAATVVSCPLLATNSVMHNCRDQEHISLPIVHDVEVHCTVQMASMRFCWP